MSFQQGDKVGVYTQGWWHGIVEKVAKNGMLTVRWEQAPSEKYVGTCDRFTANGVRFGCSVWHSVAIEPLTEAFLQREQKAKMDSKIELFVETLFHTQSWRKNPDLQADLLALVEKYGGAQ